MPTIKLPDGSKREYKSPVTGEFIANEISKSLAKEAVAVSVDGEFWDLSRDITTDASVEVIKRDSPEGLEILRHDAAHILAEAVKELWPETQVTIGPAIDNGFYYDFARDDPFTPEDLETIAERMLEIVKRDEPITREVWKRKTAIDFSEKPVRSIKLKLLKISQKKKH